MFVQAKKNVKEMGEGTIAEVASDIFAIRCSCLERLKFEVEYGLKRGTTENTYLIKGETRASTVLIDLPPQAFETSYVLTLQKAIAAKRIGKIILTQLQPDAIPVLKTLVRLINVDGTNLVEVYARSAAIRLLEQSLADGETESDVREKCTLRSVVMGESMKIGEGLELEFVRTGTPRWPDMMAVYAPQRRILFSSKLFSAHVASRLTEVQETVFDVGGWQTYGEDWRYFFETMLAPSANQVAKALQGLGLTQVPMASLLFLQEWIGQLMSWLSPPGEEEGSSEAPPKRLIVCICPSHGPVVRNALHELVENYREWIQTQSVSKGSIAVFYASAYGNTAALAQAISHGTGKSGIGVKTINLEISDMSDVERAIDEVDGFIIGSPTLGGHLPTQVQTALGTIVRNVRAKQLPCGVFGSFGWSGEAVDELNQRLRDAGFKFAFDPIKVKMKPTAKVQQQHSFPIHTQMRH